MLTRTLFSSCIVAWKGCW